MDGVSGSNRRRPASIGDSGSRFHPEFDEKRNAANALIHGFDGLCRMSGVGWWVGCVA